jgi:hypothetical protein
MSGFAAGGMGFMDQFDSSNPEPLMSALGHKRIAARSSNVRFTSNSGHQN